MTVDTGPGLPTGWRLLTLGDVARWGSGGTPRARHPRYYPGDIPWAVIGDLTDGPVGSTVGSITAAAIAESSAKLVPEGAVLIAMYGSIGKLGITTRPMATNQAIAFAVTHDRLAMTKYLFYYLMSQRPEFARAGKGATQQNIGQGILKAWPIPVPPIEEQRRIVDTLEDHLSRLDAAEADLRAASARAARLRMSALSRSRAQLLAAGCELRRIGSIADTALGKMLDAKRASGKPTPYLRNVNVRWGRVDTNDVANVPLTEQERRRFALVPGDLLVCEGGEPGRCAIWQGSDSLVAYQKALHRVRVTDASEVRVGFLALMLEEVIRAGRADRMFTGTTIKHLPQERLRMIEVPVPDPEVQSSVEKRLARLAEAAGALTSGVRRADRRAQSLRRAVLAAAFTGNLQPHSAESIRPESAGV